MEKITIVLGILLSLLGGSFFAYTGFLKFSALIPVPLGLIFIILGFLAQKQEKQKLLMHISSLFALLGSFPLFMASTKFISLVQGTEVSRPLAVVEQVCMGFLCLVYFILCFKYFIDRQREKKS